MPHNTIYYGDNLKIMRENITDNSIDLVYLDPPFNSKAYYNVLFREPSKLEILAGKIILRIPWLRIEITRY